MCRLPHARTSSQVNLRRRSIVRSIGPAEKHAVVLVVPVLAFTGSYERGYHHRSCLASVAPCQAPGDHAAANRLMR